ncbi:uncharacterized protein [Rutidosis leptorrhynchoides]|uniref:uncharacterized protein n=1 Tax=Rutidosis leptorrhynchoides TaxID=125765 RepID=UPI003A99B6FD
MAFDSIDWFFLDDVLRQMNFCTTWRHWISGCIRSARTSILINGSPTEEFQMKKGLRQGDPLSHFLFIVAIEALNVAMKEGVDSGIFKGVSLVGDNVIISHLQYADDALFFGEWSVDNASNLIRIHNWLRDQTRATIQKGGLGIGSLKSKNLSLLGKWWWRFRCEPEVLWAKVIRAVYRPDSGLSFIGNSNRFSPTWKQIRNSGLYLEKMGIPFVGSFTKSPNVIQGTCPDCWIKLVLKKVNLFIWRLCMDLIPTQSNLSKREVSLMIDKCPFYETVMEDIDHLFNNCGLSKPLWRGFLSLWGISSLISVGVINSITDPCLDMGSNDLNMACLVARYVLLWATWKWRNKSIHAPVERRNTIINEDILEEVKNPLAFMDSK